MIIYVNIGKIKDTYLKRFKQCYKEKFILSQLSALNVTQKFGIVYMNFSLSHPTVMNRMNEVNNLYNYIQCNIEYNNLGQEYLVLSV